jgi:transposase
MDSDNHSRHISRLEIVDTGHRRRLTVEEKLRIVEESFSGPRLASATARVDAGVILPRSAV